MWWCFGISQQSFGKTLADPEMCDSNKNKTKCTKDFKYLGIIIDLLFINLGGTDTLTMLQKNLEGS